MQKDRAIFRGQEQHCEHPARLRLSQAIAAAAEAPKRRPSIIRRVDILAETEVVDFYEVLCLPRTATSSDVKAAYHNALLLHHPDKALSIRNRNESVQNITPTQNKLNHKHEDKTRRPSIDDIQQAYSTLVDPILRAEFDIRLARNGTTSSVAAKGSQRPAEIVSFDEFVPEEKSEAYIYPCRCGSVYRITEDQLEAEVHLLGCQGCSEVVWVGYDVVNEA